MAFVPLNSQMKSIWKGSIAFGLVNIPVKLYSATESQSLASHILHKKDLSRIRFQRVAESTGKKFRLTGRVRCLNLRQRPFLECNSGRGRQISRRQKGKS